MASTKGRVKKIGFWLNEKKCKKFEVPVFEQECRKLDMEVVKLDLSMSLHDQGPFDVIIHKMTAIYAQALSGNKEAQRMSLEFEDYVNSCPHTSMVDPLPGVHTLLHRPTTYALLDAITRLDDQVMTPTHVELPDTDLETKKKLIVNAGCTFPIVCKPVYGCGGTAAHEMAVVFSERRLSEWRGSCVAQSFVPHDAVLYKLYVLGDTWHLVVRPSLKNFKATDAPTVHFNSAKVSKAGSCSPLTQLDQQDRHLTPTSPNDAVLDRITRMVRTSLNMDLLGIDVVIDNTTGQYAIIDVNPFPSYDSISDLMPCLAKILRDKADVECTETKVAVGNGPLSTYKSSIKDMIMSSSGEQSDDVDILSLLVSRNHISEQCAEECRALSHRTSCGLNNGPVESQEQGNSPVTNSLNGILHEEEKRIESVVILNGVCSDRFGSVTNCFTETCDL